MEFTLLEAFLLGLFYWYTWWDTCLLPFHSCIYAQDSVTIGLILGLAYGDVTQGLFLGGSIGLMFMGVTYVGANIGSDTSLSSIIAISIALKFGWDVEAAMVVAVAFALLGAFLDNARRLINGMWHRDAERRIKARKYGTLWISAVAGPLTVGYLLRGLPLTILFYLFGTTMGDIVSSIPTQIMNGLAVVGGILPACGLVLCISFIGKSQLLPFFIIGFIIAKAFGLTSVTTFALAICCAVLYLQFTSKGDEEGDSVKINLNLKELSKMENPNNVLTKKDHWGILIRTAAFFRGSQSLEYFFGTGFMFVLKPYLAKIYKNDPDGYQAAMERHLVPFITEPAFGACIHGLALAMEEEIAAGSKEVTGEAIVTMKTSLMGPFAGLGDSILWSTLLIVVRSLYIPMAVDGHWYAVLGLPILIGSSYVIQYYSHLIGYKLGGKSIVELLQAGMFQKVLLAVSVMGMMMMGFLVASNARLTCGINFGADYTLQSIFDSLIPGFLLLVYSLIGYNYLNKGGTFIKMMGTTAIITFVLGCFGILV